MSVVIKGFDKPASCLSCPFNLSDCWCSITHGGIDRDYYDCDIPCPIEPLDSVLDKIRAEIEKMTPQYHNPDWSITDLASISQVLEIIDKYKAESEERE